jgi:glyoxylase-like metal-dependent hydrolase (beta-lactamase superfamily II)
MSAPPLLTIDEVVPGIQRVGHLLGARYVYVYLVSGARPLLVDTGIASSPGVAILPALRRLGVPPATLGTVLLTHADVDHFGGNAAMRQAAPRAALVGHAADRPWYESRDLVLRERYGWYAAHDLDYDAATKAWLADNLGPDTPLDRTVAGGEWLDLGDRRVRVLHLPGHSPGHVGVWEPQTRTAVIGDAVLERGLYDLQGRRISPPPYFAVAPYRRSIAQLLDLEPEHLLTAHYPAMRATAAAQFLRESAAFVDSLERAVTEVVASARGPLSLREVTRQVDARLGPYSAFANELAGPVKAHLDALGPRWAPGGSA